MSRKSRKNEAFDLPSFQMIRAASNGDIEAINAVLKHYEGYIAALSTRKMYDENRQVDIPDGWNYAKWDVEQEVPDWGLQIQIGDHENSIIMISGQHGTLNVSGMYPDPPEIFITNQGIEASYYKDEFEMDSGETYVNQHIVIGQMKSGFYGIILQMPREIYDDNIEPIQKLLESVKIVEN